jgi:hypothetical protein
MDYEEKIIIVDVFDRCTYLNNKERRLLAKIKTEIKSEQEILSELKKQKDLCIELSKKYPFEWIDILMNSEGDLINVLHDKDLKNFNKLVRDYFRENNFKKGERRLGIFGEYHVE